MIQQKIIHIDMDAFFASVEQRDDPSLRGRPIVVGGQPNSRGVVAACSYEARRYGIRSAMACSQAQRLCAETVFVKPRFEVYRDVSKQIRAIFNSYTSKVEPLSLDEAYLDVTFCQEEEGSAIRIAQKIKEQILKTTSLTASAGVSYNKFLAKTASDMDKPNGLYIILPEQGEVFVAGLDIGLFYGVGPVTERKMRSLGINCGEDLRAWSMSDLCECFGKAAQYYYNIARGVDLREVESEHQRKSIGSETTFAVDVCDMDEMLQVLENQARSVVANLQQLELSAGTLTVKVRFDDFSQVTRSYSTAAGFFVATDVLSCLDALLRRTEANHRPVRLLGVSLSALGPSSSLRQLSFEFRD